MQGHIIRAVAEAEWIRLTDRFPHMTRYLELTIKARYVGNGVWEVREALYQGADAAHEAVRAAIMQQLYLMEDRQP